MSAARRIGFLGAGNMAGAMIRGLVASGTEGAGIIVRDVDRTKTRALRRRFGVAVADDAEALVRASSLVVLAVKPQILPAVLEDLRPLDTRRALFVSIAAGFPLARLERGLGEGARVVRAMPNTPALLGKGVTALVRGRFATPADERRAVRLFRAVGEVLALGDEALLDPVTGLSGSGPAFVYLFAEALIAAGEREGLAAETARTLALRTLEGAAAMLLETGMSPRELRDMVTSPGGTTRAGLDRLEKKRFTEVAIEGVVAATRRSRELARAGS